MERVPAAALAVAAALAAIPAAAAPAAAGPASVRLPYEVVDGLAVHDGDIVLGPAGQADRSHWETGTGSRREVALHWSWSETNLWPGGVVPYVIDGELPEGAAESVRLAIAEWNAKTVVTLVERTFEADYLRFVPSHECRSYLGRIGGEQEVWSGRDGDGCGGAGMVHEIGHAVGLDHEHQRADRDGRLMVGRRDLHGEGTEWVAANARTRNPYDYRSRMHYSMTSMETIPPGINLLSAGLSAGDIDGVARLYGQPPSATVIATNPPGLEVLVDGVATTAPKTFDWPPGSVHTLEVRTAPQTDGDSRYLFGRWNDGAPRVRTVTATPERTWIEANFIVQRRVTGRPHRPGEGTVTVSPPGEWHTLRSTVRIEAQPRPGSGLRFVGWSVRAGGDAQNPGFLRVGREGLDAAAYFSPTPHLRIGATAAPFSVWVDGSKRAGPLSLFGTGRRTRVSLRIEEIQYAWSNHRTRYRFEGWSDGSTRAERDFDVPAQGGSLSAHLLEEHLLDVAVRPREGGSVSAEPPGEDGYHAAGAEVALSATPSEGWSFVRWQGDAAGDGDARVRMDGGRSVDAWFSPTRELRPGATVRADGQWDAPGVHLLPRSAGALAVEFSPDFSSPAAEVWVGAVRSPYDHPPWAWSYLHRSQSGVFASRLRDEAAFVSASSTGPHRIEISPSSDPPLDPEAVYFVTLATDGWPAEGTLRIEASGTAPRRPLPRAWPRAFTLVAEAWSDPAPQTFKLHNDGDAPLHWEHAPDPMWLAADPPAGTVPAGEAATLSVRTRGLLAPGTHEGTLRLDLRGPAGPEAPLELPVTFVAVPAPAGGR
ncbi:MAG: M12 family metallopeptidase [Bryobacterales bacterium]|nr:M12 family metallopeptidase [Bryobacterales bacterium]